MLFFRADTDKKRVECPHLVNSCAGTTRQPIFIIGSGPSLTREQCDLVRKTSIPTMVMNFSGRGKDGESPLLWPPTYWTAWDQSPRFHPSIFTSPLITKFMMGGRTMDLVPGTTLKTCDCPNLYFVDVQYRPYSRFFSPDATGMMHCLDSFIMALDICYQLGYRTFYCLGTDLRISPSPAQKHLAASKGVIFHEDGSSIVMEDPRLGRNATNKPDAEMRSTDLLQHFSIECIRKGLAANETEVAELMQTVEREEQYAFSETKPFLAAVSTDKHYWTTVQYLRLARRAISLAGVEIVSCTPGSRLNAFFPYRSVSQVVESRLKEEYSPLQEQTAGRYTSKYAHGEAIPWHADVPIYGHKEVEREENRKAVSKAKKPCGGCGKKNGQRGKQGGKSVAIPDIKGKPLDAPAPPLNPADLVKPQDNRREEIIRYYNENPVEPGDAIKVNEEG